MAEIVTQCDYEQMNLMMEYGLLSYTIGSLDQRQGVKYYLVFLMTVLEKERMVGNGEKGILDDIDEMQGFEKVEKYLDDPDATVSEMAKRIIDHYGLIDRDNIFKQESEDEMI